MKTKEQFTMCVLEARKEVQGFRCEYVDAEGTIKEFFRGRLSENFCWEKSVGNVQTVGVAWAEERCKVARFEWEKRARFYTLYEQVLILQTPGHRLILRSTKR